MPKTTTCRSPTRPANPTDPGETGVDEDWTPRTTDWLPVIGLSSRTYDEPARTTCPGSVKLRTGGDSPRPVIDDGG